MAVHSGHAGRTVMIVILALAVLLSACSSAPSISSPSAASGATSNLEQPAPAAAAPTSAPAAATPASTSSGASGALSNSTNPASATDVFPADRMVIKNAKLVLQVPNVEVALARVREIADAYGGYVNASSTSFEPPPTETTLDSPNAANRAIADLTIAVRADQYDRAMNDLRGLATKVDSEESTSQDVTDQYVDLDSELQNLRASQDALLKLMNKATQLQDILTLQQQLSTVQGKIQQIEGRERLLKHETAVSMISVSLRLPPVAPVKPTPAVQVEPTWSPVATFDRGWAASLLLLQGIANVVILVMSFFWWLIPIALIGYLVYRRERGRSRPVAPPPSV